jgi:hypothetical protein
LVLEKPLDSITQQDLKQLIENKVLETKNLDYKESLVFNGDRGEKEFLADVSSFANSSGGDIIYGISQCKTTGLPENLVGVVSSNIDKEIQRLESIIREGIEPRIPSVAVHPVRLADSKTIIIIRVQKSWCAPHRIKFSGDHRFYARNSAGKYELDVGELRNAFTLSENLNDKIRRFREKRIANIFANETPVPFCNGAKLVLHIIPLISFNSSVSYDIDKIHLEQKMPINSMTSEYSKYNLEGQVVYAKYDKVLACTYTQFYRNGIIEAVEYNMLNSTDEKLVPSFKKKKKLIESFTQYLSALQMFGVQTPLVVFLTFVGIKGYSMDLPFKNNYEIDRDVLFLPEVWIERYDVKADQVLRPIFDAVWNSFGLPKSGNYNDKGEWG